ncbi:hypothetical protein [Streptomyces sp. NPDC102462]
MAGKVFFSVTMSLDGDGIESALDQAHQVADDRETSASPSTRPARTRHPG